MAKNDDLKGKVFLACARGDIEDGISTINWNSGQGPVRVYERDYYDGRMDLGRNREENGPLPYHGTITDAIEWMRDNPGEWCQIAVRTAVLSRIWKRSEFAL